MSNVSHHGKLFDDTKEYVEKDFKGRFEWTSNGALNYSSDKTRQSKRYSIRNNEYSTITLTQRLLRRRNRIG